MREVLIRQRRESGERVQKRKLIRIAKQRREEVNVRSRGESRFKRR